VQTARSPPAYLEAAIAFGIESKEKFKKDGTPYTLQGAGKVPVQGGKPNVQTTTYDQRERGLKIRFILPS
jgi:hypothetical protein